MFAKVINTKNGSSVQMNMDSVTNAVTNTMTTLFGVNHYI